MFIGITVCYRYSKTIHITKNCKEAPSKKDNEQEKKENARVFALTKDGPIEGLKVGNFKDEIPLGGEIIMSRKTQNKKLFVLYAIFYILIVEGLK